MRGVGHQRSGGVLLILRQWCHWRRGFVSEAQTALLREYEPARPQPLVLPFVLSEAQARERFLQWQRSNRLAPGSLLAPGTYRTRAAFLPFWLFTTQACVEYAGSVGYADSKERGAVSWRQVGWRTLEQREHGWEEHAGLRVYASYKYRRDFVGGAVGGQALRHEALAPLPREAAEAGSCGLGGSSSSSSSGEVQAELDPPYMRQAIAWEFASRSIRERELAATEQRLLADSGAQRTRDVRIKLQLGERRAQLAFLPCYFLEYEHGETFNEHGERRPERFEAIISGSAEGGVAGLRHYSAARASAATGAVLVTGGLALSAVGAPLVGLDPLSLVNIETAFMFAIACSTAGLGARTLPLLLQQGAEARRVAAEEAEVEKVVGMGVGPLDLGTDEQEIVRSDMEWRRWEESGKETWRESKRQAWAEQLWESQHRRRIERREFLERMRQHQERAAAEERRESRRQRRWGHSSHHQHFAHGGAGEGFLGGVRAGGARDYLGYYRLLGLQAHGSAASQDEIKRAFRQAALHWHPDKQAHAKDEASLRQAREHFHQIRAAYDVLRDPERRRAYDRGEVVQL